MSDYEDIVIRGEPTDTGHVYTQTEGAVMVYAPPPWWERALRWVRRRLGMDWKLAAEVEEENYYLNGMSQKIAGDYYYGTVEPTASDHIIVRCDAF